MNEPIQQKDLNNSFISVGSEWGEGEDDDDNEEKNTDYSVIDENLPEVRSKRGDKPLLYEDSSELIENEDQNDDDPIQEELDDLNAGQESIGGLDYTPWSSVVPRMRRIQNMSEDENLQEGVNPQGSGHQQEGENRGSGIKRFFSNMFKWIGIQISRLFSKNTQRRYDNATSNALNNTEIGQTIRKHDLIPGWNGEKFEKGPNGEDNILADFRRVPTVWSQLTAARAEDSKGKPLPPKISIYVRQNQEAEDDPNRNPGTDQGHSSIGIEYSRWSLRTSQYERYNLRYGFFPADDSKLAGALGMSSKAIIPSRLKNEAGNTYSIRRTFPATAKQVNKILAASQTYPDKGYNAITRNCTTFVREMIQNEAGIPAGDKIFRNEEPGPANQPNDAINSETTPELWKRIEIEKNLENLSLEDDLSYGGFGNKSFTRKDYRNYKESLMDNGDVHTGDLPNAATENMRNLEGKDAGEIGSRQYYTALRIRMQIMKNRSFPLIIFRQRSTGKPMI